MAAILLKGIPEASSNTFLQTVTTTTKHKGELRIKEINNELKKTPRRYQQDVAEDHAQEVADIYCS